MTVAETPCTTASARLRVRLFRRARGRERARLIRRAGFGIETTF
jgi:hypothetical protein